MTCNWGIHQAIHLKAVVLKVWGTSIAGGDAGHQQKKKINKTVNSQRT